MVQGEKGTNEKGTAGRVADTAVDFAIGGSALVADKAVETIEDAVDRAGEVVRKGRRVVHDKAVQVTGWARPDRDRESDARRFEDRTRADLYALAAERGIEGRSTMRKHELIAALRQAR